jgi:hypothetical protein
VSVARTRELHVTVSPLSECAQVGIQAATRCPTYNAGSFKKNIKQVIQNLPPSCEVGRLFQIVNDDLFVQRDYGFYIFRGCPISASCMRAVVAGSSEQL